MVQISSTRPDLYFLKIVKFSHYNEYDVKCLDKTISFLNAHTILLCLLVLRECMWLCSQFKNTSNHVSGSRELHIEHVIEG